MKGILRIAASLLAVAVSAHLAQAKQLRRAPKLGEPPEAENVRLAGMNNLQARSAYQPLVHKQGDRYIAYVGHHGGTADIPKPLNPLTGQNEFNGTSILDVTDPKKPKYLFHIPGEEGLDEAGGGQMVRVCDGKQLPKGDPNAVYLLRTFGNSAHEIWNVATPEKPTLITRIEGLKNTHKNWWECDTGIAFLVSGVEGWRVRRMTQVYDLSDPAHPVKIRDFGIPGQQPGATGPAPEELHGGISLGPKSNRVYFGYGTNKNGMVQIVDREKLIKGPPEVTDANLAAPEVGRLKMSAFNGAHTVFPMPGMKIAEYSKEKEGQTRDIALIVDEELVNECREPRQMVWFADITIEKAPVIISSWSAPEKSGNFCERGGRFGSHSTNESMEPVFYKKLAMITFFNAGLRVLDVRNPYQPREVGYFIPSITKDTTKRCVKDGDKETCKVAIQSNNVETDDRGYIYVADRANTGLHILELTGEARRIAGLK